jgi:hypothetical protein
MLIFLISNFIILSHFTLASEPKLSYQNKEIKKGRISPPQNSRDNPLTILKLLLVILRLELKTLKILMP